MNLVANDLPNIECVQVPHVCQCVQLEFVDKRVVLWEIFFFHNRLSNKLNQFLVDISAFLL